MDLTLNVSKDPIEGGQRLSVWLGLPSCSMVAICRVMLFSCESTWYDTAKGSLRIAGMAETMAFNYNSESILVSEMRTNDIVGIVRDSPV